MKPKKLLTLLVVVAVSIMLMVPAFASEGGTITLWDIQTEAGMRPILEDSIARFEAANPGYTVEETALQNEDYKSKIVVALGSGTAPDVFITWTGGGMVEYIDANQITPLDDYLNKDNYKDRFMDAGIAQATVDGKIWAVPVENCSVAAIFYNSALFDKYGLAVPTTLTELENVCDTFVANGIIPFALANKSKYVGSFYYMYLVDRMAGPDLFANAAARKDGATFEDPAFLWAGQKLQEWAQKGYFGEGYTSLDAETGQHRQMFYNGEAAMILDGAWTVATYYNENSPILDSTKIFSFPVVEGGKGDPNNVVGTIGDNFYVVSSMSKAPEMSFELIKYLIDDTAVQQRIDAGKLPPTKNAYAANPLNKQILELMLKAPHIQLWYDQYLPSAMAELHKDQLQALIALEITPEEYDSAMENGAQKYLTN